MAVLIAILSFVVVLLIGSALFFQGFYVVDKRRVCSNATVEYFDGKGSIVNCYTLNGSTLYYIEKKLEVGSEIKILDFDRVKSSMVRKNFYLKLHRYTISKLSEKSYYLAEGVCCMSDRSPRAKVERMLDRNKSLCVDVSTREVVVVNRVPSATVTSSRTVINYDKLAFTPPIRVTKVISV